MKYTDKSEFTQARDMELLYAYAFLWMYDLGSQYQYNAFLDKAFLAASDNDVLLELEECSENAKSSFARIKQYFEYESSNFDTAVFGKALFSGLEAAYKETACSISEFGNRCYKIWTMLPDGIQRQEPFHTLLYADDCLSYGDEQQTKKLYERAFVFYHENE